MNNLIRKVDFSEAILIARDMTKWIPGLINMGVFYLIGVCNGHLLDMKDYAILVWLVNYLQKCSEGKTRLVTDSFYSEMDGAKREFFWVNYEILLKQLPNLGIKTVRALWERFKRFCDYMILEHHTDKSPNGTYSYFRFNPTLFALLTSNEQFALFKVPKEYGYDFDEESMRKIAFSNANTEDYVQRNESEFTPLEAKFTALEFKSTANEANFTPKDCVVTNSEVKNYKVTDSERDAVEIKNMLEANGISCSPFQQQFLNWLTEKFASHKMDEKLQKDCIDWLATYAKNRCKNQNNLSGYFYRSVYNTGLIDRFLAEQAEAQQQVNAAEAKEFFDCPVCGTKASIVEGCGTCGLSYSDIHDAAKINFHKRLVALQPEKRKAYEAERDALTVQRMTLPMNEWQNFATHYAELDRKYGLID